MGPRQVPEELAGLLRVSLSPSGQVQSLSSPYPVVSLNGQFSQGGGGGGKQWDTTGLCTESSAF